MLAWFNFSALWVPSYALVLKTTPARSVSEDSGFQVQGELKAASKDSGYRRSRFLQVCRARHLQSNHAPSSSRPRPAATHLDPWQIVWRIPLPLAVLSLGRRRLYPSPSPGLLIVNKTRSGPSRIGASCATVYSSRQNASPNNSDRPVPPRFASRRRTAAAHLEPRRFVAHNGASGEFSSICPLV